MNALRGRTEVAGFDQDALAVAHHGSVGTESAEATVEVVIASPAPRRRRRV